MAYVPASEQVGDDTDSHASKMAAMFGGAAAEADAPVSRNFKTLRRPKSSSGFKPRVSSQSLFSDGGSDAGSPPKQPVSPRGVVSHEEHALPTSGGWAQKFENKEQPLQIRRRSLDKKASAGPTTTGFGSRPLSFRKSPQAAQSSNAGRGRSSTMPAKAKPEVVKATPKPVYVSRPISISPTKAAAQPAYPGGPPPAEPMKKPFSGKKAQSMKFKPSGPVCPVCAKSVYKMEEVLCENVSFHKWCFRCSIPDCNKRLTAGKYASYAGQFYCKPCFMKCFKQKGNYDEGFGHEQQKHKWDRDASPEKEVNVVEQSDL